jgi:hypothetical protein
MKLFWLLFLIIASCQEEQYQFEYQKEAEEELGLPAKHYGIESIDSLVDLFDFQSHTEFIGNSILLREYNRDSLVNGLSFIVRKGNSPKVIHNILSYYPMVMDSQISSDKVFCRLRKESEYVTIKYSIERMIFLKNGWNSGEMRQPPIMGYKYIENARVSKYCNFSD